MDDLLYLTRFLLNLKDCFNDQVNRGAMTPGDSHFMSLCLSAVSLHEAGQVDLTSDEPIEILCAADANLADRSKYDERPYNVPTAVKGDGFHHGGSLGLKEFDL